MTEEKENDHSHDGYVKILYNTDEECPTITMNTKCYSEEPLSYFRWFVKISGEKILQQAFSVTENILEPEKIEWHDIETVFEKDIK